MSVTHLPPSDADIAVDVLCDAFHDYPVMRYVLGASPDYDQRLHTLVGFFVAARVLRDDPILAVHDDGRAVGVGIVTLPRERPVPKELVARREATWRELGAAERERYEAFGAAMKPFAVAGPHHHLNMLGVRRSHAGRGFARTLLEAVHALAEADRASCGVTLSTETENNVALYRHFGYRLLGRVHVAEGLESWAFFRAR